MKTLSMSPAEYAVLVAWLDHSLNKSRTRTLMQVGELGVEQLTNILINVQNQNEEVRRG
jgi:hypothetical protein